MGDCYGDRDRRDLGWCYIHAAQRGKGGSLSSSSIIQSLTVQLQYSEKTSSSEEKQCIGLISLLSARNALHGERQIVVKYLSVQIIALLPDQRDAPNLV
jgi:hypothetical protein